MVIAHRANGGDLTLEVPYALKWLLGVLASISAATVLWTAAVLRDHDQRITALEASRLTLTEAAQYVTLREFDTQNAVLRAQLARIESKIDRLTEPN